MVKLLRVDHRLLHGQVAFSWTQNLGVDAILIANDDAFNDELRKTTLKLAKPQGVKLVIKDIKGAVESLKSGATDDYKLFVVTQSVKDAYTLAKAYDGIKTVNLGGTRMDQGGRSLSNAVSVSIADEAMLKELIDAGVEIEIRQVPTAKKIMVKDIL